jgi:hypothetical protein
MTKTTYIGGTMYGDGEIVVDFSNVDSQHAPLEAHVLTPSGAGYRVGPFAAGERPSVKLAASIIGRVRGLEWQRANVKGER